MSINVLITTKGAILEGKAPQAIQAGLDGFVTEATMFLLAEVKKRTPQGVFGAQGGLLGSEQAEVTGKGTPVVKGVVFHGSPYGDVVEKGRDPGKGMPPKGVLVRWLEVKLGLDEKTAMRIEFVVRRKIGIRGTEGAHMFERSVTENQARLDAMAERRGLKIATALN